MELSIIIVNYKSRAKLFNCLASIDTGGTIRQEILVVDNASGDDLRGIQARYPEVRIIMSPRNLGMGGGNNLALDQAGGEFILILNPDTVLRPGAVDILLGYLRAHPEVTMVGPKLLNPDGSLQLSCLRWPSFFMPVLRRTGLGEYFKESRDRFMMVDSNHAAIRPVDWLMGSCLLFRKEFRLPSGAVFRPRFDERYFMYFEDTDLARQIWQQGGQVIYHPEAVVVHDHHRESARHPWYLALLMDWLAWRHIASWLKYFMKWGFKTKLNV